MNHKKENILTCKSVKFYCLKDEDAFFEWINKIECIHKISCQGKEIYLHMSTNQITDLQLDDLIGLMYRYKIEMKQLSQFLNENNKKWFYDNKKTFWHKKVFGS